MINDIQRIVLKADIKCGFKDLYVVEKGIYINIDFLADKSIYKETKKKVKIPTRLDIFNEYKDKAEQILYDFGIYDIIKENLSTSFASAYFFGMDMTAEINKGYPETFKLTNFSVELISEKRFKDLRFTQDDANSTDFIPDFDIEQEKELPDNKTDSDICTIIDGEKHWLA